MLVQLGLLCAGGTAAAAEAAGGGGGGRGNHHLRTVKERKYPRLN